MGYRLAQNEQELLSAQYQDLAVEKLEIISTKINQTIKKYSADILNLLRSTNRDAESLRALLRKSGQLSSLFILDNKGRLIYPHPNLPDLSQRERDFYEKTKQIWESKALLYSGKDESVTKTKAYSGWYTYYWNNGLQLLFFERDNAGNIFGAELSRMRFMADIISNLPDDSINVGTLKGNLTLTSAKGERLFVSSEINPNQNYTTYAEIALEEPLSAWHLSFEIPENMLSGLTNQSLIFNIGAGTAFLIIALALLAIFTYLQHTRELREASERVSFVNRVSHELKTPLTNIRMYAELLKERLVNNDEDSEYVDVVLSESERLSRLINNVLTFQKKETQKLSLRKQKISSAEVINEVIKQFTPQFKSSGIEVVFQPEVNKELWIDTDLLKQILYNLFSNVEKYAAAGGALVVSEKVESNLLTIDVFDSGPGIPTSERKKIFEPFYRISNQLTEGVSGAGIGLALSRDLARLHGGDLNIIDSEHGSCFRLTLNVSPTSQEK